jgi:hypothetical protein
MRTSRWRKFEQLVAALQRTDAPSAQVDWNAQLGGRQFDVVLRFALGSHSYLTVFECKDQDRPVQVGDIDAFVTKARDAGASKAVMVSSSGFQAGAFEVARRHHVELFTLNYIEQVPDHLLSADLIPTVRIVDMKLRVANSDVWEQLPEDRGLPAYLEAHMTLETQEDKENLLEFIDGLLVHSGLQPRPEEQTFSAQLSPPRLAYFPHQRYSKLVDQVQFGYLYDSLRALKQKGIDPTLLTGSYEYRDLLSGKVTSFPRFAVLLEHDTTFVTGRFYFHPSLEYSYYCQSIDGAQARLLLVESYQHGVLVQAVLRTPVSVQRYYVEVTDSVEVSRLRRVADNMFRHQGVG